jgi:hypothetical protein
MIHSSVIIVYTYGIIVQYWVASLNGNWSWYANRPAMQIIKNRTWPVATATFTTDSIIIIDTKARSYKYWRYSYKNDHARKV